MKRSILFFLILTLQWNTYCQDSLDFSWSFVGKIELESSDFWTLDGLNNNLIISEGALIKIDTAGKEVFSQSIKSLGSNSQLIPVNSMKIIHFSEEQQTLCFFDNTLTKSEDCIELVDLDLLNASLVCGSSRSESIWVFDDVNSSLSLISTNGQSSKQELINLNLLFGLDSITQLIEKNSRLYLVDGRKGIYIFDLFGSLVEVIQMEGVNCLEVTDESIFIVQNNTLMVRPIGSEETLEVELPIERISNIIISNGLFHFRTKNNVHKYRLQF